MQTYCEKEKHVKVLLMLTIKMMPRLVRAGNDQSGSSVFFFTETFLCTNQFTSQPGSDISGQAARGGQER